MRTPDLFIEGEDDSFYVVQGVPPDQTVYLMRIDGVWKILRSTDNSSSGWYGSFDKAEEALQVLRSDFSI